MLAIGLMLGATIGLFVGAALAIGKLADLEMENADLARRLLGRYEEHA